MKCVKDQKLGRSFFQLCPEKQPPRGSGSCNDQCQLTAVPPSWIFKGLWHTRTEVFAWLCPFSPLLFCRFVSPSSLKYIEWSCFPEKSWVELVFKTGYYILFTIKIIPCGKHPPNFYYQLEKSTPKPLALSDALQSSFFYILKRLFYIHHAICLQRKFKTTKAFYESLHCSNWHEHCNILCPDMVFVFQEALSY